MISLLEMAEKHIIVGDGATGTVLHQLIPKRNALDLVPLSNPDELLKLHLDYINAGAMVIQTHTFGTSRPRLAKKNMEDRFEEVNAKAVKIARDARDVAGKDILIAGSIGPHLQPTQDPQSAICEIFCDQAVILDERGVDFILLETFPSIEELTCAIKAIKEVSSLPIVAQMTVPDEWSPTPEGSRDYLLRSLAELPVEFVGLNCGTGPDEYLEILEEWGNIDKFNIAFQPNAGVPVRRDGRFIYPSTTPDYFAYFAKMAASQGVKYIGGCCGTTPEHIKAVSDAVRDIKPKSGLHSITVTIPMERKEEYTKAESDFISTLESGKFTTVVQLDPPKGTNIDNLLLLAKQIKKHPEISAVDINANPLGRLHFDSLWLAGVIENQSGIETIPHVTPRDASLMGLESQLLGAWYSGVRNLLVITGDPSQMGDYPGAYDVYQTDSIGLVRTISRLNHAKDWGGNRVGNPPNFVIGVAVNPGAIDRKREIEKLKQKVDAGARFAMSQVFFTWDVWETFWSEFGSKPPIPVLFGVWPLTSLRLALRIHNEIPEIQVPDELLKKLEDAGANAREIGWELAKTLYRESKNYANGAYLIAPYKRGETILQLLEN